MTQLFRAMIEAADGRPLTAQTARGLGLREGEIPVDDDGLVRSGDGGLSVAYDNPRNLPPHRRPPEHGGTGSDPCWELSSAQLTEGLEYRPDPDLEGHGFVEPAWTMEYGDYLDALLETRDLWRINR
jgi:hypothetical protein